MDFAAAMVLAGMISFVPPTIVLYLVLSPALSKQERRYTAWSFAIILILETILYLYFFHIGIFKIADSFGHFRYAGCATICYDISYIHIFL